MSAVNFPTPFTFHDFEPVTLVELRMRFYSCTIRAKPLWWEKVHDPAIVAKWRAEILEHDIETRERLWGGVKYFSVREVRGPAPPDDEDGDADPDVDDDDDPRGPVKQWPRDPVTGAQLDYIIDSLKYAATKREQETGMFVSSSPPCPSSAR